MERVKNGAVYVMKLRSGIVFVNTSQFTKSFHTGNNVGITRIGQSKDQQKRLILI